MTVHQPPQPLVPLVRPFVDPMVRNLVDPNARQVIRVVAGWLISMSYHPQTKLIARVALRTAGRLLQKEAGRVIPPEAHYGPLG